MNQHQNWRRWQDEEAAAVTPPAGAAERGWDRLDAALAAGTPPRADILAPARAWSPWLVLGTVLLAAIAWSLWPAPQRDAPPPIEQRTPTPSAPVEPSPIVAPEPIAAPPELTPAAPTSDPAKHPRTSTRRKPASDVPKDSFAAELKMIAAAQAALRDGDTRRALRVLANHTREHPDGHFAQDREALRAVALCEGGRMPAGARLADRFLAAHPDSIHADRVRDACDL